MRTYSKIAGILAASAALCTGYAQAEVEQAVHAGYNSDYIFRGADFGSNMIEAGYDASTEISGLTVSAGAWYANTNKPALAWEDELDLYTSVAKDLGFAKVDAGYIWYHSLSNDGSRDAQEASLGLSRNFFGVDAYVRHFFDVEVDNDGYTELGLGKSFELQECVTLNTGLTAGYLVERGGFSYVAPKVSVDVKLANNVILSPYAAYSIEGGQLDASAPVASGQQNHFYGGVMFKTTF
jgi:hypothetical protein